MDGFRFPANIASSLRPLHACTSDGTLLYIASKKHTVFSISSPQNGRPEIRSFFLASKKVPVCILAIDVDPAWDVCPEFAVLTQQCEVYVTNFKTGIVCKGHKAHVTYRDELKSQNVYGGLCYTKKRKIVSILNNNTMAVYCPISNTYRLHENNPLINRNRIVMLKGSPYNDNLIVAGSANGLIIIYDIEAMKTLFTLRTHDTPIKTVDFIRIKYSPTGVAVKSASAKKVKKSHSRKPVPEDDDPFDIYSFDHLENEFGTLTSSREVASDEEESAQRMLKPVDGSTGASTNDNFDFAEACQDLKNKILSQKDDDENGADSDTNNESMSAPVEVTANDIKQCNVHYESDGDKSVSGSDSTSYNNRMHDFDSSFKTPEQVDLLASMSDDAIVIWNITTGEVVKRFRLRQKYSDRGLALSWIGDNKLVSTNPNGAPDMRRVDINETGQLNVVHVGLMPCSRALSSVVRTAVNPNFFWSLNFSSREIIGWHLDGDNIKELAKFSACAIRHYSIRECPLDLNKVSIAGNGGGIYILTLSDLKPTDAVLAFMNKKVQSKVLALAWHPENESLLAFSTGEGRVGVYNTDKPENDPEIMSVFSGHNVYRIAWASLKDANYSGPVLFACSDGHLVFYPQDGPNKFEAQKVKHLGSITSIAGGEEFMAFGTQQGVVTVCDLSKDLNILWSKKISAKYVSDLAWSPLLSTKLAACSFGANGIYVFNCENVNTGCVRETMIPTDCAIVWIRWNPEDPNLFLTTGYDYCVNVWCTEDNDTTIKCIARKQFTSEMFCAIFSPLNSDEILCSGDNLTVDFFNWKTNGIDVVKKLNKNAFSTISWATSQRIISSKLAVNERMKISKAAARNDDHSSSSQPDNNINTSEAAVESNHSKVSKQMCYTTIMHLTRNLFTRNVEKNFDINLDSKIDENAISGKLFSTADQMRDLLSIELKNHQTSNNNSIGTTIIPQMTGTLRDEIVRAITSKSLTEEHISLAPSISYDFWFKCSDAFIAQNIEIGNTLKAVQFALACHKIDVAIDLLKKNKFFAEAWSLAKLRKDASDPILGSIYQQWVEHLEQCGNLEGAAYLSLLKNNKKSALDLLLKRKSPTEDVVGLIERLKSLGL